MKSNDALLLHSPGKAEKLLSVGAEDQPVMPRQVDVGHADGVGHVKSVRLCLMSAVSKAIGQQVVEYLSRAQGVGHTQV